MAVPCCGVRSDFSIKTMFGSSFPPVVCRCLFYVICVCLRIVVSNTYRVVFFVLFVFVLCAQCCQFLQIAQFVLPFRCCLAFFKTGESLVIFIYIVRITGISNRISLLNKSKTMSKFPMQLIRKPLA